VVGYWALVLFGGFDAEAEVDVDDPGLVGWFGLGGVPITIVLSILIAVGWFVSLAGTALLNHLGVATASRIGLSVVVLLVALIGGWLAARLFVRPLRRIFSGGQEVSRSSFVGSLCVIRTGQVTVDFGQAEVTAADGSSAIIQVRYSGDRVQQPEAALTAGSTALIYDYDVAGEFFWVTPVDATLGPNHSTHA
ncbi:MAG TPA: hypothetical protein VFX61_19375, partial [Micromonosporaceae bacterium]|nr:hypothetical protein [Micromonosporaceae bacterium]